MKKSLKSQLNLLIRIRGEVPYDEIKFACENGRFGGKKFRMATAERRLRKSESPDIEPVIEQGYIKSYKWVGTPIQYKTYKVLSPTGEIEKIIKIAN